MKPVLKLCLLALFSMFVVLFSCTKKDATQQTDQQTIEQKSIQAIKSKFKNVSRDVTFTLNTKGRGEYTDINGNPLNFRTARLSDFACYDPADDVNGDLAPNLTLNSIFVRFGCATEYKVAAEWTISVPYHILNANPNNTAQLSRGRVRLKNSSGTFYHTQATITPITITQTGTETINGVDRYIYKVKYESATIPATTFTSAELVQVAGFFYTDCATVPTITIAYSNAYSADVSSNNNKCKRTDRIYINPPTWNSNGTMSTYGSFAGINAFTSCSGGTYVTSQHVKVTGVNGVAYDGTISAFDIVNLTNASILPHGSSVIFEYYNIANCSPDAPTVTEVWTNW